MNFRYLKQNLFVKEKTFVSLVGCFVVWLSFGFSGPVTLIGAGVGMMFLAMVLLLEYMAINFSQQSLYLNSNYVKFIYRDINKDYFWDELLSARESWNSLYLKFQDGQTIPVLKDISDYEKLRNIVAGKINIATQ